MRRGGVALATRMWTYEVHTHATDQKSMARRARHTRESASGTPERAGGMGQPATRTTYPLGLVVRKLGATGMATNPVKGQQGTRAGDTEKMRRRRDAYDATR